VTIREALAGEAATVARLHAEGIPDGFLVSLGPAFLRRLYARAIRSGRAEVLVATAASGEVVGFVAVADDVRAFFTDFLVRDGVAAAFTAAAGVLRAPRSVFETLRYGGRVPAAGPAAEILALAVDPGARGRGLGTALAAAAIAGVRSRGGERVRVLTAVGNDAAARAYTGAGMRRRGRDAVHGDVVQDVFEWP